MVQLSVVMFFCYCTATQAQFKEVYNVQGGIHSYAIEVDASIGTY